MNVIHTKNKINKVQNQSVNYGYWQIYTYIIRLQVNRVFLSSTSTFINGIGNVWNPPVYSTYLTCLTWL